MKHEIVDYVSMKTNFTAFDVKWMPWSAKIMCVGVLETQSAFPFFFLTSFSFETGRYPNKNGVIACFELEGEKLKKIVECEKNFVNLSLVSLIHSLTCLWLSLEEFQVLYFRGVF